MPDLHESAVAFCDILGFSKLSQLANSDTRAASSVAKKIEDSFREMLDLVHLAQGSADRAFRTSDAPTLSVRTFSDNICLFVPLDRNQRKTIALIHLLPMFLGYLQMNMISEGFFLRGGLVVGQHYASDLILFGPALVRAYKLESEKAVVPRIVVDQSFLDALNETATISTRDYGAQDYIVEDEDGQLYIDYLHRHQPDRWLGLDDPEKRAMLHIHRKAILDQAAANANNLRILSKYLWVAQYHNRAIAQWPNGRRLLINLAREFPASRFNPILTQLE